MLRDDEQRIWDDVERHYAEEVEEPVRRGGPPTWRRNGDLSGVDDMPAAAVAGLWAAIMLVLFGAVAAGLAIGAVTAVGWLVWHRWPRPDRTDPAPPLPADGTGRTADRDPAGTPRHREHPAAD